MVHVLTSNNREHKDATKSKKYNYNRRIHPWTVEVNLHKIQTFQKNFHLMLDATSKSKCGTSPCKRILKVVVFLFFGPVIFLNNDSCTSCLQWNPFLNRGMSNLTFKEQFTYHIKPPIFRLWLYGQLKSDLNYRIWKSSAAFLRCWWF